MIEDCAITEEGKIDYDYHATPDGRLCNKIRVAHKYQFPVVIEIQEYLSDSEEYTGLISHIWNERQFIMQETDKESIDLDFGRLVSVEPLDGEWHEWPHIPVYEHPACSERIPRAEVRRIIRAVI